MDCVGFITVASYSFLATASSLPSCTTKPNPRNSFSYLSKRRTMHMTKGSSGTGNVEGNAGGLGPGDQDQDMPNDEPTSGFPGSESAATPSSLPLESAMISSRFWSDDKIGRIKCRVDWNYEWNRFVLAGMKSEVGAGFRGLSPHALKFKKSVANLGTQVISFRPKHLANIDMMNDWRIWMIIISSMVFISAFVTSQGPEFVASRI